MLRGVLILLAVATFIGAMMPETSGGGRLDADAPPPSYVPPAPAANDDEADSGAEEGEPADEPADVASSSTGPVQLQREADGHFYAQVEINGQPVRFVIDTGASGIALTQDDARRAGIFFSPGEFDVVGRGASGDVRGIPVAIDRARLGHKLVEDVGGVVLEGGRQSLLGQEFLSRFESVEIRGTTMTLR